MSRQLSLNLPSSRFGISAALLGSIEWPVARGSSSPAPRCSPAGSATATGRGWPSNCAWPASTSPTSSWSATVPTTCAAALRFLAGSGVDLIITSGGLGPTADDLTAEVVADFQGRPPALDAALEQRIADIVARLSRGRGWRTDPRGDGRRDPQAGAACPRAPHVLEPVGTAPGLVVPPPDGTPGHPSWCCPARRASCRACGPGSSPTRVVDAALAARRRAAAAHDAAVGRARVRARRDAARPRGRTRRTRDHDLPARRRTRGRDPVRTRRAGCVRRRSGRSIAERFPRELFSADGRTVDEIVADALLERGLTIATAESCTAGGLASRLTDRPGSSAYLLGGMVVYSNAMKTELAGVPAELIERVGAVSAEVALALADGARDRVGADIGVGITGIAGPDGGTPRQAGRPRALLRRERPGTAGTQGDRARFTGRRPRSLRDDRPASRPARAGVVTHSAGHGHPSRARRAQQRPACAVGQDGGTHARRRVRLERR